VRETDLFCCNSMKLQCVTCGSRFSLFLMISGCSPLFPVVLVPSMSHYPHGVCLTAHLLPYPLIWRLPTHHIFTIFS
jgi:hypothetical protein